MAKTLVIDSDEGTRVPFLRGILTRSLQEAGLGFDEAYRLAIRVRQELANTERISTRELRELVLRRLQRDFGRETAERYRTEPGLAPAVLVRDSPADSLTPFNPARYRHNLESCGVTAELALEQTERVQRHLLRHRQTVVDSATLGRLTYRWLRRELGMDAARRYLVWTDYRHSGRPLVVLIGGCVGSGKSTIATELANRLEIVRIQSTDMLREVMRMLLPARLLPGLHVSSFSAWSVLPQTGTAGLSDEALADGFRNQADLVSVPCEAVIRRAMKERVSLILEGVHVHPSLLERLPSDPEAVVVPVMLAVLRPEALKRRLGGRGSEVPQRRAERYLQNFDAIWRLQSHLLSEADRLQIPIVENSDRERAVREVLGIVIDALARKFRGSPRQVFRMSGKAFGSAGSRAAGREPAGA